MRVRQAPHHWCPTADIGEMIPTIVNTAVCLCVRIVPLFPLFPTLSIDLAPPSPASSPDQQDNNKLVHTSLLYTTCALHCCWGTMSNTVSHSSSAVAWPVVFYNPTLWLLRIRLDTNVGLKLVSFSEEQRLAFNRHYTTAPQGKSFLWPYNNNDSLMKVKKCLLSWPQFYQLHFTAELNTYPLNYFLVRCKRGFSSPKLYIFYISF